MQNENQILYLHLCMRHWLQVLSDMLRSQKNYVNDGIVVVTWTGYKLQTRYKMKTRFCISISACTIDFKLCQVFWSDKIITSLTRLWLNNSVICTQVVYSSWWRHWFKSFLIRTYMAKLEVNSACWNSDIKSGPHFVTVLWIEPRSHDHN